MILSLISLRLFSAYSFSLMGAEVIQKPIKLKRIYITRWTGCEQVFEYLSKAQDKTLVKPYNRQPSESKPYCTIPTHCEHKLHKEISSAIQIIATLTLRANRFFRSLTVTENS